MPLPIGACAVLLLGSLACAQAATDVRAARQAWDEGRFADAHAAFAAARAAAGDDTPPQLHYDEALAALRAGALGEAEAAAERAAAAGGGGFVARREFLLGNVAFERCRIATAQARGPEAEPFAFDVAIALATRAGRHWQAAVRTAADDWPQARRNAERAQRQLAELERERDQARADARKEPEPEQQQQPEAKPLPLPEGQVPPPERAVRELAAGEVMALLERVDRKQQEKVEVRQRERRDRLRRGERDW